MEFTLPDCETARLEALRRYKILDTAPEEEFDQLTSLAAKVCQTPIALITLIDSNRQWFKSKVGFTVRETPRETSFCSQTILKNEVLIIPDTLAEESVATNPLVISEPHVRFYAGAPLISPQGYPLGTICVMDYVPRELNPTQLEVLQALSHQVITKLELRRNLTDLAQAQQYNQQLESKLHIKEQEIVNFLENGSECKRLYEELERFFHFSPDMFCIAGLDGYFKRVNPAFEKTLLYPANVLLSKPFLDFVHPEDQATTLAELEKLGTNVPTIEFENRYRCQDGSYKWLSWDAFPLVEEGLVYAIARDVTESKQIQEQLQVTQQQLRHLVISSPAVIYSCLTSGDYGATFISNNVSLMLGYESREFLEDSQFWAQHIHPEDTPRVFAKVKNLFEQGHHTHKYRFLHKDGTYRWLRDELKLVRDANGEPLEIVGYWIDITEQKQAEEALQKSESRYRAIVEDQTELICRFSPNGKLTFVNHTYCRYFGKPYEELIGEVFFHMIPKEEHERIEKHLASLTWANPVGIIEHYAIIPNGEFRTHQWIDRAIFNKQGKLVEFQSVGRDITAQKQADEVLRQKSRTLESFSINLKHLHRINTTNYQDFDTLFTDCLKTGCEIFGLSTGIISQVIDRESVELQESVKPSYIIRSVQSELEFLVPGLEFELKDTYCAAVVQNKKTITYPHVGKIAAMCGHPVYQNLKLESYIGTPIFVHGQVYGTLNFSSTQVKSSNFEPHEQEIIELMAQSIGRFIAAHLMEMERQRVENELRRQNRRSQLFAEVTLKIRQSLQLEEILRTTVTEVQKFLQADRVIIFQLGFDGSGKVVAEAVVQPFLIIQGKEIIDPCFEEEYMEQYLQGRVGVITDIEQADMEVCYIKMLQQFGVRANLVVPILQKQELWGLLIVHQCSGPRQWTNFETELLRQIADQIGIALAQAQLLERETRQRQELARSNVELQQFAYIASHDLQEPLRKIQAFGDRLKFKFSEALTDQGKDYLERMQNAAERMQVLIDDLLSLSRVTTKTQPFIPVNLTLVAQNVLSDLEIRIQETGAQIAIEDLPTVEADPLQMRQLLQNLIGNALKFHSAKEQLVVKIYSQQLMTLEYPALPAHNQEQLPSDATNNAEFCQILVKDNGIGFEEKYLDRIFNAFQRLHGRSEYPGTGIGLAICRKIVERHSGSITATSVPGQGATFMVTLPLKQDQGESGE